jgi:hypothetical protein
MLLQAESCTVDAAPTRCDDHVPTSDGLDLAIVPDAATDDDAAPLGAVGDPGLPQATDIANGESTRRSLNAVRMLVSPCWHPGGRSVSLHRNTHAASRLVPE